MQIQSSHTKCQVVDAIKLSNFLAIANEIHIRQVLRIFFFFYKFSHYLTDILILKEKSQKGHQLSEKEIIIDMRLFTYCTTERVEFV